MTRIVQKFGGTSMGSPERIQRAADIVEHSVRDGVQTAVVVSAMSGETNRLIGMAHSLSPEPDKRELDQLVSTGEQVSASLLAIELQQRGIAAHSYTGAQAGFRTEGSHSRARIRSVECDSLFARMDSGEVVILTGFQGVNEAGDVTTLGRGGSDTSAVALAIALKADVCDIYTDVDGVYTTDPRLTSQARKIDRISYEEMLEMASQGAKVLQNRSVELAMRFAMPIHLRSSFSDVPGTLVTKEDEAMERAAITSVAYNRDEAKITIKGIPDHPGIASHVFGPIAEAELNVDVIVQNVSEDGTTDITFTVPRGDFTQAMRVLQGVCDEMHAREVKGDDTVAKVSIIGVGMRSHSGVARQMFEALADKKINIQMITTSEIKITVVIEEQHVDAAVRALHTTFELDATLV
ncbi:MAG: aspartate kinase [Mariprofundaceae bacterium]